MSWESPNDHFLGEATEKVFDDVLGSDRRRRPTGALPVNEHELADFLETGRRASAPGTPGSDAAARVRDLLGDDTTWAEPSPAGVDELIAAIEAEAAAGGPAAPPSRPARARPPAHRRSAARPGGRRLMLLSAAAALALLAGAAGFVLRGADDGGGGQEFDIAGTELAPEASAVARVEEVASGVDIRLDVRDLPPAAPGTYYQAWLRNEDAAVTIGTFHMQGGDDTVDLWAGVPLDRYPTLTVTLQQEGAGAESSGQVVLRGDVRG
jgi:Anti-sigma-K factor rskA